MKDPTLNDIDWVTEQIIKIREALKEELNRIDEEEKQ